MKRRLDLTIVILLVLVCGVSFAAEKSIIGSFGPTGVEIDIQKDKTMEVIGVQAGSPSDGKFNKGQIITAINGRKLVDDQFGQRHQLSDIITNAESTDGVIKFDVKGKGQVKVKIPVLGPLSRTWPLGCDKTKKIIRANADFIANNWQNLADHKLEDGLAILMLLSTGEQKDLDVVRKIYAKRMSSFKDKDTGPHSWNNGYQGMAVCEYYLRTGDNTVMPLINAICESARRYEAFGSWTHWAKGLNPYGLMNAAGTNILTTLLLAKQCGAEVNDETLLTSLKFFYRFAGHGANPYGDHRPEDGYGSNNGKTEMLALAMNVASKAQNGQVYAMARDKCVMRALYDYRHILKGHTGPMGAMWYGVAAGLMIDKKPDLYRNKMDDSRWFYELSRRFDGSFGMSGCKRYDETGFGYSVGLSLTAPLKTLQITGAPRSKYAKAFKLPELPWGRKSDLAFFDNEGGKLYQKFKSNDPPHIELEMIADASERQLEIFASHPETVFREYAADTIRQKKYFRLIEKLLRSDDHFARHTACWTINRFQPWKVSGSPGWISSKAINKADFTPSMFQSLIKIVERPEESIWNVDGAMQALALAKPQQTKRHLSVLLKWLEYDEWWLHESTCMALSPALEDPQALKIVLPKIIDMLAKEDHPKGFNYIVWMLSRSAKKMPKGMSQEISDSLIDLYQRIPDQSWNEDEMDLSGITYMRLQAVASRVLEFNPNAAVDIAKLSIERKSDHSYGNGRIYIDHLKLLIAQIDKLDEKQKSHIGIILYHKYRPMIIKENRDNLLKITSGKRASWLAMNDLLKIDALAGANEGWKILGILKEGTQHRSYYTFDPKEKLKNSETNRYRKVTFPDGLQDWYKTDFDVAKFGFKSVRSVIGDRAPASYRRSDEWDKGAIKDAGEVILMRKVIELDDLDYAAMRLMAYSRQGYRIYINGKPVIENKKRSKNWKAREIYLDDTARAYLKKGKNIIAAIGFLQYFKGKEGNVEVFLEGLRKYPEIQ